MKTSTVYIVQQQMVLDPASGELRPKHNFKLAEKYGSLVTLLGPTAGPFNHRNIIAELREKLRDYAPGRDFLLLVGNPCLIGWTVALAAEHGPEINLLQWSSREQAYVPIRSSVDPQPPENQEVADQQK